jgi:hypothetical protein
MLKRIAILIFFFSCSQPKAVEQPPADEKIENSSIIITDSLVVKESGVLRYDTIYRDSIPNNPDSTVIKSEVAYVYNTNGVDVYEVKQGKNPEKIIGHLDYRSKIILLNPLRNEAPLTVDGIKGYYAVFQFGHKMAYVFTGYLLNFPVPERGSLLSYFKSTLHLLKPVRVVHHQSKYDPERGGGESEEYYFEKDIIVKHDVAYESDILDVTIPGMTLQQAWLLWSSVSESMQTYLPLMPVDSCTMEVSKEINYQVQIKNGKVSNIIFNDDTSCSDYTNLSADGKGARIFNGYGC